MLDGDFKQILPIIPRGSHSDIVHATINSSYLWNDHQVLILSKNMRLESNMQANQKTLRDYPSFPFPEGDLPNQ